MSCQYGSQQQQQYCGKYEYDVYGEVMIFNGDFTITRTTSTITNPYLFAGRRFDTESGNYYNRARVYSPELGRFLSLDPLGFDSGDYNLYRYALNNPTNLTDPTGEFPILAILVKASVEALVDGLMQATLNYYFDPSITTIDQAFESIDRGQVGVAFVTGLLPGGDIFKSVAGAVGDVLLNYLEALENCQEYTPEQALRDFTKSFTIELIGSFVGDAVVKHGVPAVASGLRKLGFGDLAEKLLRKGDDLVDDGGTNVSQIRPGFSGPANGYPNLNPSDLNTGHGLQSRMTIEEMFASQDFARPSTLLGAPGALRDTNKYIYVIDDMGNIWVSRAGPHHPDLIGGANAYGAGEMYIDPSGKFRLIDDESGHYKPKGTEFFSYLKSLMRSKGITFDPSVFNARGG